MFELSILQIIFKTLNIYNYNIKLKMYVQSMC